jgi:putative hydrolase of HD superfamily
VRELVDEYEARECLEAQLARDADKLECLIQAREYQAQGHEDLPPWITSAAALRSESARQLGEACQQVPPRQWWKAFAESYPRPVWPSGDSLRAAQKPVRACQPDQSEPGGARRT